MCDLGEGCRNWSGSAPSALFVLFFHWHWSHFSRCPRCSRCSRCLFILHTLVSALLTRRKRRLPCPHVNTQGPPYTKGWEKAPNSTDGQIDTGVACPNYQLRIVVSLCTLLVPCYPLSQSPISLGIVLANKGASFDSGSRAIMRISGCEQCCSFSRCAKFMRIVATFSYSAHISRLSSQASIIIGGKRGVGGAIQTVWVLLFLASLV